MIKSNELRQGNWVKVMGYDKQVWDIMVDGVNTLENECSPYDLLEPILLTPAILEKSGFTIDCLSAIIRCPMFRIYLIHVEPEKRFVTSIASSFGMVTIKDTKYLHQLQNLIFALTGEELNVKL